MAEAMVSVLLEQLTSIALAEVKQQVTLVVGVEKEVKKLTDNVRLIQDVLKDAEDQQVMQKSVRVWLDQLKEAAYDIDDVLDEWNTAMLKLRVEGVENAVASKKKVCCFFPSVCFCFKQVGFRHDIALKIKEMNENINDIVKRKDMLHLNVIKSDENKLGERVPSTYLVDVNEICGRVEDKSTLVSKLCENNSNVEALCIISIVGMGGIGKTTLAQFAYNDDEVINNFDKRIWLCVSDPFDEHRIAKAIIESLEGSATNLVEFNSLLEKIHMSIKGKKFLIVLDDVWTEDDTKWEPFHCCLKNGLHGSKILITTRKENVARIMKSTDIISVKELPKEECWSLFKRLAFSGRSSEEYEELEEIGRKIVMKCKGLPLAAKTIGSLLRFKTTREEWQNILDSEMWKLEEFEKGIFPPLLLSYNDLPSMVKQCFSYCSIFPKDYQFKKDELIKLWMAQDYLVLKENKEMEIIGQNYFSILASRSFFQEFKKDEDGNIIKCKMHDIVHDFAQYLRKNECFMVEVNGAEESVTNSSYEKIRHLMLMLNKGASFPVSIYTAKRLHSLLIDCADPDRSPANDVQQIFFGEMTWLRALMLYSHGEYLKQIRKLSHGEYLKEIRKLIHLRYLNLSQADIEKLPETLGELYNLQTLDISLCTKLKKLPQGMGKLINLRHLINVGTNSLSYMPIGMERLTSLRTLSEFVVNGVGDHNNKACNVYGMKDLNHLQGDLFIRRLGNVTNVSEVKRIKVLENKRNIFSLNLWFCKDAEVGERINIEAAELLLEDLQPPPSLKKLIIYDYIGNTFPSNWVTSLFKLRQLELRDFINCKYLPPLGKLSSLESLCIIRMRSVKRVGNEFWGTESDIISSSLILFPKLKSLEFHNLDEWEEWDREITRERGEEIATIMPCLASLSINCCPKLKALPDCVLQSTTLKNLEIDECCILEELNKKEEGEDWAKHLSLSLYHNPL